MWTGISIGCSFIVVMAVAIFINRKWDTIKFILFMKFDVLFKDDPPENLDEMEFDAFVAYRSAAARIQKFICKVTGNHSRDVKSVFAATRTRNL